MDVNQIFQKLPRAQKIRLDQRIAKTIDRRLVVEHSRSSENKYDLIDKIWKDSEQKPELDEKRSDIIKKDKIRLRDLTKKVLGHS